MYSMAYPLAVLATCVASANAFMATGPVLRASPAPAISRAKLGSVRMTAAAPTERVVGALAEKYSSAIAHPAPFAGDSEIRKILPHRYPFLLVDKILECVPGEYAVGVKCITSNEPQFTGHFPDRPIMPGVLQIEAMAQLGGFVALQPPLAEPGQDFFFGGVDNVKWRKPLVPGDVLVMEMHVTAFKKRFGICKMQGKGYVDGKVAVEGDFTFAIVMDKSKEAK
jgi:3-hydroxyacyl-[acyl-carrier-protein] dehydratase